MKKHYVLLLGFTLLLIASSVFLAWRKNRETATVLSNVNQYLPASITIFAKSTNFELPPVICDVTLNGSFHRDTLIAKNGKYRKEYSLMRPTYITLYIPGNSARIFLAPGYKSVIHLNVDLNTTFAFEGDGYLGNSYLNDILSVSKIGFPQIKKNNILCDPENFAQKAKRLAAKRDSVFNEYTNVYRPIISIDSTLVKLFQIEKEENRFFLPRVLMNYALSREVSFTDRQSFFEKYIKSLSQIYEPVDSLSAENKKYFSSNLLTYYVDRARAHGDSSKIAKIGIYAYMLETAKTQFRGSTQSFLIEYNLTIMTNFAKIYNPEYPSIVSLINLYKSNLSELSRNNLLKKVSLLLPINMLAEVVKQYKLISESGTEISLGQKLAPVTVIDVWATWCGPCIRSFPAMLKLKEKYRHNKSVKFIWISIDQNKIKWDAIVKKMNFNSNESFWVKGGNHSKFSEDLSIDMLPRYLIIDKNGKILEAKAPGVKPDDKALDLLIDHYIKTKE